jgi:hypothetical protein
VLPRVVYLLVLIFLCRSAHARETDDLAPFSIDLDTPYKTVLAVVREASESGIVHGTFEYRDTPQLSGATTDPSSRLFPAWSLGGDVFFKVRRKALSPAHFLDSNDVGTVAVRYVVMELSDSSTRLFIDAVFVEDSGHGRHPSDGYVETSEFEDIKRRLKELDAVTQISVASSRDNHSPDATPPHADAQNTFANELAQLNAAKAQLADLQAKARDLRQKTVRLINSRAELRIAPYYRADIAKVLAKGDEVMILSKTTSWLRVRDSEGKEGWIYQSVTELAP